MAMNFTYYYNNVPDKGLCRNNLIYTSLISEDKKTFVQWYFNDAIYHNSENQVVHPELMEEKWNREVKYLTMMQKYFPQHVPEIIDIDENEKKIYLSINGPDFWELANCTTKNYDHVLPDWQEQMLEILKAHKNLNLYKFSLHPSSYFIVDGKMKSINYFFAYLSDEPNFSFKDVESHIYTTRQNELKKYMLGRGIDWDQTITFETVKNLAWNSFRTNYPNEFIDKAIII
jgi:hypothetical protein